MKTLTCGECGGNNGHHFLGCSELAGVGAAETVAVSIERIAETAHEVNRVYCQSLGDFSQPTWEDAPEWQRKSAIDGVLYHYENPNATPRDSHVNWMREKELNGWMYGEEKNPDLKTHPCMVPYDKLPYTHRYKDEFFCAVVKTLLRL